MELPIKKSKESIIKIIIFIIKIKNISIIKKSYILNKKNGIKKESGLIKKENSTSILNILIHFKIIFQNIPRPKKKLQFKV